MHKPTYQYGAKLMRYEWFRADVIQLTTDSALVWHHDRYSAGVRLRPILHVLYVSLWRIASCARALDEHNHVAHSSWSSIQYSSLFAHQNSIETHVILMHNKWRILYYINSNFAYCPMITILLGGWAWTNVVCCRISAGSSGASDSKRTRYR